MQFSNAYSSELINERKKGKTPGLFVGEVVPGSAGH